MVQFSSAKFILLKYKLWRGNKKEPFGSFKKFWRIGDCLEFLALNGTTDFLFTNFVCSKENSSALCQKSARTYTGLCPVSSRLPITKKNKEKSLFFFVKNGGEKDAKLELLCKVFVNKLTSESVLYIDFLLDEYKKLKAA